MSEHYLVTLSRNGLQIFTEAAGESLFRPRWEIVKSVDSPRPDERTGMDSRREETRRAAVVLAAELDRFLQRRPRASWDLATPSALFEVVVDELSPDCRRRLKRLLTEEAVHREIVERGVHYAAAP